MRRALLIGLAFLALGAAGCFEHRVYVGNGAPDGTEVYDAWKHHFIYGILLEGSVDLKELCPTNNAMVHDKVGFLNGLVSWVTLGIYTPSTMKVRCELAPPPQQQQPAPPPPPTETEGGAAPETQPITR